MGDWKLRPHQQRILDQNPDRALLVHEMRTGKSLISKLWGEHPRRNRHHVLVCLKQNKKEWQELCPDSAVYTKEEFKKHIVEITASKPSAISVDEVHNFAAPLFIAKERSAQAEALYNLIKACPDMHVLLLTGTPLTNKPASMHTLLTYLGHYIDWKKYQDHFYELKYMPFLPRPAYFPKDAWRGEANKLIDKYADVVSMADCKEFLPAVTSEVIKVKTPAKKYADDEEYHWTKDHLQEQTKKLAEIRKIGSGFRKVILVCHYTEQILALEKQLKKDRPVFVLNGQTKDADKVKRDAQSATDCYLIVQAKMGMGWDGYMFGCMVFVSMAHRQIDYTQMLARLTSVDHDKPMLYYYLIGGRWDKLIYTTLQAGEAFNPHKYDKLTRAPKEE